MKNLNGYLVIVAATFVVFLMALFIKFFGLQNFLTPIVETASVAKGLFVTGALLGLLGFSSLVFQLGSKNQPLLHRHELSLIGFASGIGVVIGIFFLATERPEFYLTQIALLLGCIVTLILMFVVEEK